MRQIGIIADDLTGASDAGVQFSRVGLQTQVIFDLHGSLRDADQVDVVVIDTDSRSIKDKDAYQRVSDAAKYLQTMGFRHIYKKLDSTLRGNVGIEIDAVMDVLPFECAVVVPAFPKIGRTTVDGTHYLQGVPIDQTEIARDPKCPVHESDMVKLLAGQSKRKAGVIRLETIRQGIEAVLRKVESLREENVQLLVFDAETDEDMGIIAESMEAYGTRVLWAGSAGLADFLPKCLGLHGDQPTQAAVSPSDKPVLLVAGSISQTTRGQIAAFCRQPNVHPVELNPIPLLMGPDEQQGEIERCLLQCQKAVREGYDVALFSKASPDDVRMAKELGRQKGYDHTEISNRIADALGRASAEIIKADHLQGLILTGGDTAKAVCRHIGVVGIQLLREVEPGVPLSRLVGSHPLFVVTKAGAFGTEHTLVKSLHELKGVHEDE